MKSPRIEQRHSKKPSSSRSAKPNSVSTTEQNEQHFFFSHGMRKRRIFFKVRYSEQEKGWIQEVHTRLKNQKHIEINEKQTLLRYYYSSDMKIDNCVEKLSHYHDWFTSPDIQTLSKEALELLRIGFIYSYGVGRQGRAFVIMSLGNMDFDKFKLDSFYQALNHINNKVIAEKFVLGHIQTYDYILDLNEKFLTLPISSIHQIVKTISDVYSMRLQNMYIVNCTHLAKWIYYGVEKVLSEQTSKKVKLYTKEETQQGILREFIDQNVLQEKYGGTRPNLTHSLDEILSPRAELDDTQYFSIQENNSLFVTNAQRNCCTPSECAIY